MKTLYIHSLAEISNEIGRISYILEVDDPDLFREEKHHANDRAVLRRWKAEFTNLSFEMCEMQCDRVLETLISENGYTNRALQIGLSALYTRMYDESQMHHCLIMSRQEATLFDPKEALFGRKVETQFPETAEDIAEAGKCLALKRSTAAIFHLMRAMEAAVQALANKLEIGNVDREWGKLLSDIGAKIEAMPKGRQRDRWSESHTHLYHVKQAWRNDTMHPKKTYTDEEAYTVYAAVKSFMAHLAPLVEPSA